MDIEDIQNCITLMEDTLNDDVFKIESNNINTKRLLNVLKRKKINKKKKQQITPTASSTNKLTESDKKLSDVKSSDTQTSSDYSSDEMSGSYSNIKSVTVKSDLFSNVNDSEQSNESYCNLAFKHVDANKLSDNNTDMHAKIITFKK